MHSKASKQKMDEDDKNRMEPTNYGLYDICMNHRKQ